MQSILVLKSVIPSSSRDEYIKQKQQVISMCVEALIFIFAFEFSNTYNDMHESNTECILS